MFAQKLLPALAVISVAAAQTATNSACSQPTVTINSQADFAQYSSCPTIGGSIVIGSSATGAINLDGPGQIRGNLSCSSAGNLVTLASSTITSIGGDFNLFNMTLLSTLQFGVLASSKTVTWVALPALPSLVFGGPLSRADSVTVSNTFLNNLDGINLQSVGTLQIDNNNNLKKFETQIANITDHLNINANGNNLAVSFPNLIWAANMTFRNTSSVKMPSLAVINGSLGFYGNYMDSIMAPNLTSVGNFATGVGSLALVANGKLANISFPSLTSVGGANQIANNTALSSISFASLKTVGGAIDFSGNFSTPSLPAISNIKGGFNIQSQQAVDCSGFQAQSGGKGSVIQGTFICKTTEKTGTLGGSTGTSTGTSSSSSSTSTKNAAASYGVTEAVAGLSVVGSLLQMLL